jgi:hypothetical protein
MPVEPLISSSIGTLRLTRQLTFSRDILAANLA